MSDVIKLLPDHVANQIAAGEVVQRPASVVKELLENAIDAGATKVSLTIEDAGKSLIQVMDNGKGMSMTDARMAFERHATSKISQADDLFQLRTKGFRGEALASIVAVAQVSLKTARKEDELGTHIELEGSIIKSQEPVVTPQGTMISVRNLFFNIPARRKFLKSDNVELRNITDEFHRVAMIHADIAFTYTHNGSELFNLPATGLRQRIVNIMGNKVNEQLVPVTEDTELVKIHGFIGKPEYSRKTKGYQFFFVNDRYIKHSYFHHAVTSAFEGLLRDKHYPSYFLYLTVPTESVDINIHPTKTEVKFDNEHEMYAIIRATIKHALGQFTVDTIDFQKEPQYEVPYDLSRQTTPSAPKIEVNPDFNPFKEESFDAARKTPSSQSFKKPVDPSWEALYTGLDEVSPQSELIDETPSVPQQEELFEASTQEKQIFQLQRKFIVTPLQNGMLIIHQHRAHYRIVYEQLLQEITAQPGVSQQLLFPIMWELNAADRSVLSEIQTQLENTGFSFKFTDHSVEVTGVPMLLNESEVLQTLQEVIEDQQSYHGDTSQSFSQADRLATCLSKNMAIRSGVTLSRKQMEQLTDQLFACKEPEITPDKRKVFIQMTGSQINSKFN